MLLSSILFFVRSPTKSYKGVAISFSISACPSVRLSACKNSRTAEPIFLKSDIGEFYKNFSKHSNSGSNLTKITDTSHGNLNAFLRASRA
jgi:hypothetical protein